MALPQALEDPYLLAHAECDRSTARPSALGVALNNWQFRRAGTKPRKKPAAWLETNARILRMHTTVSCVVL